MSERTMEDLTRQVNPFICTDEPCPLQATVYRIVQSLSIIDHALDFKEDDAIVSFDNNQACGLRYVVAGLRDALLEVAEHVYDLERPPTESQDNVSKIPGPD